MIICKECHKELPHYGKGLCLNCYCRLKQRAYNKTPGGQKTRKEYYEKHKEERLRKSHEYYQKHKEKLKQYGRDYWKRKHGKKED